MAIGNEDSITIREVAATRRGRAATPVLLIGSFVPESARVVSVDGPVSIGRGRMSAGDVRNQDIEVILHSDPALSRPHLRIADSPDGWTVADLESTNGTFVDGRRVTRRTALSDG